MKVMRNKKRLLSLLMAICMIVLSVGNLGGRNIEAQAATKAKPSQLREYYFVSAAYPTKSVNMYVRKNSELANNKKVNLYNTDKSETQRFKFVGNKNGNYLIVPTGTSYTVNVASLKAGTSVIAYKNNPKNNEYFIIEKVGSGYCTLRMENKPDLYLTATSNSTLSLAKRKSGKTQLFKICDYTHEQLVKEAKATEEAAKEAAQRAKDIASGKMKLAVPSIKQTDSRWRNHEFVKGASPKCTIGNYGCLMTSVTAVMSYYNKTVYRPDQYYQMAGSVLKFEQVKPKTGAYKNWSLAQRSAAAGNMKSIPGWANGVSYNLSTIKKLLESGTPVIVGGGKNGRWHYVVVYGYTNYGKTASDYYIMDPSNQSSNLGQHISKFGRTMYYKK